MEKIANNQHYNQAMAKSMIDKLFFLDMAVDIKSVVDFGCADGTLLKCDQMLKQLSKVVEVKNETRYLLLAL